MRRYGNFDRLSFLRVIHPDRRADRPAASSGGREGRAPGTLTLLRSVRYLHTQASRASRAAMRRILLDQPKITFHNRYRARKKRDGERENKHPVTVRRNSRRDHFHG